MATKTNSTAKKGGKTPSAKEKELQRQIDNMHKERAEAEKLALEDRVKELEQKNAVLVQNRARRGTAINVTFYDDEIAIIEKMVAERGVGAKGTLIKQLVKPLLLDWLQEKEHEQEQRQD